MFLYNSEVLYLWYKIYIFSYFDFILHHSYQLNYSRLLTELRCILHGNAKFRTQGVYPVHGGQSPIFIIRVDSWQNQQKWLCAQRRFRSAWASVQSDQAQWATKDPSFLHADSEESDQTERMPRLICLRWVHMSFSWFCHEAAHYTGLCYDGEGPEMYSPD